MDTGEKIQRGVSICLNPAIIGVFDPEQFFFDFKSIQQSREAGDSVDTVPGRNNPVSSAR